jgi:3-hydroxyisobutyrate dehydrogenase-like beta-hydroxyacid dehydrogenase
MQNKTITVLNPGDMGASVGACARAAGHRVLWVSEGRSAQSAARAAAAGLETSASLAAALSDTDVVLSICPPHAALDTANAVAATGFSGLYIDGNAIAPQTARKVGEIVRGAGARFGDGGIIGPPPGKSGTTRMYFSGAPAAEAAGLFEGSLLATVVLDGPDNAASSIKMCYAAWTKGSTALLADIRALAGALDVEEALLREWELSKAGLAQSSATSIRASAFKAWRWIAEMDEIADSFESADLPDGFHRAAAQVYERLAPFKDARNAELAAVLDALRDEKS